MNSVALEGKVNRVTALRYSPSGIATLRFSLAVPQKLFEKESIGYFEVQFFGELAETLSSTLKIGKSVVVQGHLWARYYRNKEGVQVSETKVLGEKLDFLK